MKLRGMGLVLCVGLLTGAVWLGERGGAAGKPTDAWTEVAPGVFRSPGQPAGYALTAAGRALLIDAPCPPEGLKARGIKTIDTILLTHHHRDSIASLAGYLSAGCQVRAPVLSAPWLQPEGVAQYWRSALPLRGSRTAYLVVPEGLPGVDCSLREDAAIEWSGWASASWPLAGPLDRPHRPTGAQGSRAASCCCSAATPWPRPGKLWSPYTTDWDHWTDAGLQARRRVAAQAGRPQARPCCCRRTARSSARWQVGRAGPREDRRGRR